MNKVVNGLIWTFYGDYAISVHGQKVDFNSMEFKINALKNNSQKRAK